MFHLIEVCCLWLHVGNSHALEVFIPPLWHSFGFVSSSPNGFHYSFKVRISVFSKNTKYLIFIPCSCLLSTFQWIRESEHVRSSAFSFPWANMWESSWFKNGDNHDIQRAIPQFFPHSLVNLVIKTKQKNIFLL